MSKTDTVSPLRQRMIEDPWPEANVSGHSDLTAQHHAAVCETEAGVRVARRGGRTLAREGGRPTIGLRRQATLEDRHAPFIAWIDDRSGDRARGRFARQTSRTPKAS